MCSAGKSFDDDDVELICSKSGLEHLQALTDALSSTSAEEDQQALLQVGTPASASPGTLPALYCAVLCCAMLC